MLVGGRTVGGLLLWDLPGAQEGLRVVLLEEGAGRAEVRVRRGRRRRMVEWVKTMVDI